MIPRDHISYMVKVIKSCETTDQFANATIWTTKIIEKNNLSFMELLVTMHDIYSYLTSKETNPDCPVIKLRK